MDKKQYGRGMFRERPLPDERIELKPTDRQIRWLRFLNLHGPLPSQYLFDLEGEKTDSQRRVAQKQLQRLWLGGYIYRPRSLWETANANYNHYCYDLDDKGKAYLKENDLWINALRPTGWMVHQLFVSCVTATMDIMCQREGYTYIPPHEYLGKHELTVKVAFVGNDGVRYLKPLTADAVFAIDYGDESYLAFALEADRNNETSKSKSNNPDLKTDQRCIRQYHNFITTKQYVKDFGRDEQLVMLFVTTTEVKVRRLLKRLEEEKAKFILIGLVPEFDRPFKPPGLLKHLFNDKWIRPAGKKPFTIKKTA